MSNLDQFADRVTAATTVGYASQRRVLTLMVHYEGELMRSSAEHLLISTSARFGHLREPCVEDIVRYATDELAVWGRRPGLLREPVVDIDEDDLAWLN